MSKLCLVADIGGTNTRVALADGTQLLTDTICKYPNADANHLRDILIAYRNDHKDHALASACIAVAGPVHGGEAQMTNLNWLIQDHDIATSLSVDRVGILNDLQAQGYALPLIGTDKLQTVQQGHASTAKATRLVIGIGTGFNAAPSYDLGHSIFVPPAEAGHIRLPVSNQEEAEIAQFVSGKNGFASVEHILSGRGLERLDQFYHRASTRKASDILMAAQAQDTDALRVVAQFARFAGSVAGDLALTVLPFGGIYFIGGVARAMLPYMTADTFGAAFSDKDRFATFNEQFSVQVIEDDFAALRGCAGYAQSM